MVVAAEVTRLILHGSDRGQSLLTSAATFATVTARFGPGGITICDPNRAGEGADKVFEKMYDSAL